MATNIIGALGGGSGIDTNKLVTDLVEVRKAPLQERIDSKKTAYDTQISGFGALKSSLSDLNAVVAPLKDPDLFNAKALNVPTTDVITTNSISASALAGTYQVEVTQIATAQSLAINSSATAKDEALNKSGNLTFKFGTWTYGANPTAPPAEIPSSLAVNADKPAFTIAVATDDSLEDIAKKINDSKGGVQASVLEISGQFQLLLTADSGADNAIEITTDTPASLSEFEFKASVDNSNITETQRGGDSKLKLNGLEITRESNNITDVIQGLDFTLNKTDIGNPITFSITQDKSTAEQAVRDLVTAYNLFFETAGNLTGVKTDENNQLVKGELASDGTAKDIVSRIRQTIGSIADGLSATDEFNSLTHVGIRTKQDGTLEIIEADLRAAFDNNFDKMSRLFATDLSSSSSFMSVAEGSFSQDAVPGKYTVNVTQAPTKGVLTGGALDPTFDFSTGTNTFSIKVDGTDSGQITLTGNYATAEELAADMQSQINGDSALSAVNALVDVRIVGGVLQIESRQYGSNSNISFTAASVDFTAKAGIDTSTANTTGLDVIGTINGEAAFGAGNILLPAVGSAAYGLNITIKEGVPLTDYTFTFTRGVAGDINNLINDTLASQGSITAKEELIAKQQEALKGDQIKLDNSMTAYQARLSRQFIAMEKIIASLDQTKSQLTGLIDRLPLTAQK